MKCINRVSKLRRPEQRQHWLREHKLEHSGGRTPDPRLTTGFFNGSWYFKKKDALGWTPYMDECLLALKTSLEGPADEIFSHPVKLQLIIQTVFSESSHPQRDYSEASRAPPQFHLKPFQSQLLELQQSWQRA
jgi:hypothetical protein